MQHQLTKEDWVDMFKQIGLTEDQMKKWHHNFEKSHPDGHNLSTQRNDQRRLRACH